jgi:RNA polymerase sigma-70 factor, ECF subfamily
MEQLMDSELVRLAQRGEGLAFNILVDRYQPRVTQLVYRYVRDTDTTMDLVQDIFFKIFRNLVMFKGDSKFSSWLFRVAANDCIDHLRRVKVRKEQSLDQYQENGFDVADQGETANVSGALQDKMERRRIAEALDRLPDIQKSVVIMKVYEEMTFDQIAEILNEPVSTVKSRLYKALQALGGILRQSDFIETRGRK